MFFLFEHDVIAIATPIAMSNGSMWQERFIYLISNPASLKFSQNLG